jgi:hypothetical protein
MDARIATLIDSQIAMIGTLRTPQTNEEWDAFIESERAASREFNQALKDAAADRKAVTVEMLQEQLPACGGFAGTGKRCESCRVRRQQHR